MFGLALSINICYYIFGYIGTFWLINDPNVAFDFYGAFMPAVSRFLANPTTLYANTSDPFKYLPEVIYYFMIYYAIPSTAQLNLLACSSFIFIVNLACCKLLFKIATSKNFDQYKITSPEIPIILLISLYFITPVQYLEYVHGQVNVIINLFMILSIYSYLNNKENWGLLFIGCASIFKLTTLFLVPVLIFKDFKVAGLKKFVTRVISLVIPFMPSVIVFLVYPSLIRTFISVNLFANQEFNRIGNASLTKFINWVFSIDVLWSLIIIGCAIYIITFYVLRKYHLNIIERFMLGMFASILISPDFYAPHLLFLAGIFSLWFIIKPRAFGWKYKLILATIIFSYFIWAWLPVISLVVLAFYFIFIFDIKRSQSMT